MTVTVTGGSAGTIGAMAATPPAGGMTIDELARRAGTTSRNVRAYQERGLLPPPEKVGRTGYYDEAHLERLEVIAKLLGRGFSLAAIGSLLEAWESGDSLADVLGFEQALATAWSVEEPEVMRLRDIEARLPSDDGSGTVAAAVAAGLFEPIDGRSVRVSSPRLLELAEALHAAGIPVEVLAEEGERLARDADAVAERFVQLFLDHVWQPYLEGGARPEELPAVTAAIERTRRAPSEAVAVLVAQAMSARMAAMRDELLEVARGGAADGDARPAGQR